MTMPTFLAMVPTEGRSSKLRARKWKPTQFADSCQFFCDVILFAQRSALELGDLGPKKIGIQLGEVKYFVGMPAGL